MSISTRFIAFFFSSVFFLVSVSVLQAQVLNVESFRTQADADTTAAWNGETVFDVSLSKFNEQVFKLGNETNAAYFTGKHRYLFLTSVELINVDGSSVISNGYFHLRGTFVEQRRFSPEIFTQFQYNENLGLKERFLAGGSVRYRFLNRDDIRGSVVTGLMYEHEKWGTQEQPNIVNEYIKSTSNVAIRGQLSETTQLLMIGYYQARPDQFLKPRVTSENQLNMRISRHLTYRVRFTLTYDTEPVIDIPNLTYTLRNGLIISF
ncbi:DUF481 domain-containing protein [Rhodohalobacter sp. SW132]|uniref:DUF481 domain-containing protein n=1 Tax=Rhodohalobacter sp. SW132 TaxID=2293433 RepID=UPI000E22D8C2|nr:DUF481 domain-containing protein [Rhodohalobacter sp. SW132]REL38383.1 DUF481 domain-containing protein [Rhodohalobacter sp. SW132]